MRGIYKITNPECKIYIGLSKNIEKRWKQYKNKVGDSNNNLQESLKYLGYDNHLFEIKELIEFDVKLTDKENNTILRKREKFWIDFYKSNINGLNQNKGGSGPGSQSEESKQKISEALKNKPKPSDFGTNRKKWQHTEEFKDKAKLAPRCPILMFNLEGDFIHEFPNQQVAADFIGAKKQAVWNFLNGHCNPNGKPLTQVKGYKFKYK
jgi:group I intron endonuclease